VLARPRRGSNCSPTSSQPRTETEPKSDLPEDIDELLQAWAADAAFLKSKPGFISTQLHRGIAGSSVFLNTAVWESVEAFRNAFGDPTFQATFDRYPDSTVASPGQVRDRVAARRGRNIGVVAAARELIRLAFYGLRDRHIRALPAPTPVT
jgi:heme-degrading monooxygenase HmoA